jgi:hypothetical protein
MPLAVEFVSRESEALSLLIRDLSPGRGVVLGQLRPDCSPGLRRRVANQIDHDLTAHQGPPTPMLRDVADHAVRNLVPLARPRRKVAHGNTQPCIFKG